MVAFSQKVRSNSSATTSHSQSPMTSGRYSTSQGLTGLRAVGRWSVREPNSSFTGGWTYSTGPLGSGELGALNHSTGDCAASSYSYRSQGDPLPGSWAEIEDSRISRTGPS